LSALWRFTATAGRAILTAIASVQQRIDHSATPPMIRIEQVRDRLPAGFELLRHAADGEAYDMLATLAREWGDGTNRFDGEGEALVAAYDGNFLVGMGGIRRDPHLPEALRMSRFYVRPPYRRRGVARMIAAALLERPETADARMITLNAPQVEAARFWEALGFIPDARDGHTHIRKGEYAHA
jgi:GNAT superfamily N-acetyltransferase